MIVALLTAVVEAAPLEPAAVFEAAGFVVTVVIDVLVAVGEPPDDAPAEPDVLVEELTFPPGPEAVPDAVPEEPVPETIFDEAVPEEAPDAPVLLAAEPAGVVVGV